MGLLTREQIIEARDIPERDVEVPEWGGTVRMRGLSAKARDEYEMGVYRMHDSTAMAPEEFDLRARLVELCIVDESGNRMFVNGELRNKNGSIIGRLFGIAQELSGMGEKAQEDLGKG